MVRVVMVAVLIGAGSVAAEPIALPQPDLLGGPSLHTVLAARRSMRDYLDSALNLEELAQLLWAGQGITSAYGFRTAPSAGGLYPLTLYAAVRRVSGVDPAVYRYDPRGPALTAIRADYVPHELWAAALQQEPLRQAPVVIAVTGTFEITEAKYGARATQYVYQESGFAAQNILLEATALGLAAVPIGAFYESQVAEALGVSETPFLLIPVGRP